MPWEKKPLHSRMWSSLTDVFLGWWKNATGPFGKSGLSPAREFFRRALLWAPAFVLLFSLVGGAGFYFFTGWRARDLTTKALANAEAGNARFARLQIFSAMSLRPDDPAVKRAAALIESRLGNPGAVQMWEEFTGAALAPEEIEARAEVMTLHGSDEQFAAAVAALEQQGNKDRAAEIRSERSLRRGNMQEAIVQARAAVSADQASPRPRLRLLQLLGARHGPFLLGELAEGPADLAAAKEMTQLIDGLVDTPVADEALAIGLQAPYFPAENKSPWASAAWRNASIANPALLPAAEFLAVSRAESPEALYNKLNILYIGAPMPAQAEFAKWMLRRGMYDRVLVTASAAEAAQDEAMFAARVGALSALGRWEELYKLASAPAKTPESLRLMAKARAARELGRRAEETELVRAALREAVTEGRLVPMLELADAQGLRGTADDAVVRMCGNAAVADQAFRLARDRFGRRGQFAKLDKAVEAARTAAPSASSVKDYERYCALLEGRDIGPALIAAAVADAPSDPGPHFTQALALLQQGKGREALAVFDKLDVFVDGLPPGYRALSAAILAAAGDQSRGMLLAKSIDPALLTPGEYRLIAPLRANAP